MESGGAALDPNQRISIIAWLEKTGIKEENLNLLPNKPVSQIPLLSSSVCSNNSTAELLKIRLGERSTTKL